MPFPVVPPTSSAGTGPVVTAGVPELTPAFECRVTWRAEQFERCANPSFETDTTGWSVAAGINAAGSSITRITSDAYVGSACGRLVGTTAQDSGGHYDLGSDTYFSDPDHSTLYVATVALRNNGGSRHVRLAFGSAGTSSDRGTLDIELTDDWQEYAVRWRPSGDRTDAKVAVYSTDQVALDVLTDELHIWSPLASQVDNGALETDLTGWDSAGTSIAAAATSLAHVTGGAFGGSGHARLITTATSGSGASFAFGTRTFLAGRTYRARVGLRYESGATEARLRLGSIGTPADRGDATVTIDGTYAWYTVDWTPAADRTDVGLAISNASAAVVALVFDEAEVYEALDEVTLSSVTTIAGATSPGTEAPVGSITAVGPDVDGDYLEGNTSSPLYGAIATGVPFWLRATHAGAAWGVGWGRLRSIAADPYDEVVTFTVTDGLGELEAADIEQTFDHRRSYAEARAIACAAAGLGARQLWLTTASLESSSFFDGLDTTTKALAYLASLNTSNGTEHAAVPSPHANVGWRYRTIDRAALTSDSIDYAIDDDARGRLSGTETRDDARVNAARVPWQGYEPLASQTIAEATAALPYLRFLDPRFGTTERIEPTEVWTVRSVPAVGVRKRIATKKSDLFFGYGFEKLYKKVKSRSLVWKDALVPITLGAAGSRVLVVEFSVPMVDVAVSLTADSTITHTEVVEPSRVTITLRAGTAGGTVTAFAITAIPLIPLEAGESVYRKASATAPQEANPAGGYVPGPAGGDGLARYVVWRWGASRMAPAVRDGKKPQRQLGIGVGSHVALTVAKHHLDARRFVVRGVQHDITLPWPWYTTYHLEALPADGDFIVIGGTADQGIGSSATLAP